MAHLVCKKHKKRVHVWMGDSGRVKIAHRGDDPLNVSAMCDTQFVVIGKRTLSRVEVLSSDSPLQEGA